MPKKILIFLLAVIIIIVTSVIIWWSWSQKKAEQETKIYHIGLLQMASTVNPNIDGFKIGLAELGYIEGENVEYTYLNAEGDTKLIVQYAQQLADMKPDLIFTNTSPAAAAAKEATKDTQIPVVFSMVADPVSAGFVNSYQSSGNNLTGTNCAYIDIAAKRLEILKELAPQIKKVAVLYRPADQSGGPATAKIQAAAPNIGVEIVAKPVASVDEIKQYLDGLKPGQVDALMDPADSMVNSAADLLIAASLRLKIPLMMLTGREPEMGALAGYGVDYIDLGKQSALIANLVLGGISPSAIPVVSPRKFLFVVNLKTAEAIGLQIPEEVLQKADQILK